MELLWGESHLSLSLTLHISGSDRGNNENNEIGNSETVICSFRSTNLFNTEWKMCIQCRFMSNV